MDNVGIDLGTTNSVAARGGEALPLADAVHCTLPSSVAFLPNGTVQVGELARRRRSIDSENTIFSSKRIIGRLFDAHETQNFRDRYPLEVVSTESGGPAFQTRVGLVTPVQVAALVLASLVKRVGIDVPRSTITVTVPASFSGNQRKATIEAARAAGLGEPALLDEPAATARAYRGAGHGWDRAFVYDLGGGTFDCAIVDGSGVAPKVLAHAGDLMLGGDDVDHRLAEWVRRQVLESHNWDLANCVEIEDRLLYRCEEAKIALSRESEATIELSQVDPECPAAGEAVTLTRGLLDSLCQDLVRRTFGACDSALRAANLKPRDIDAVFLAGGTTWLSVVQQGVESYFGQPGEMDIDPTHVVAVGASRPEA